MARMISFFGFSSVIFVTHYNNSDRMKQVSDYGCMEILHDDIFHNYDAKRKKMNNRKWLALVVAMMMAGVMVFSGCAKKGGQDGAGGKGAVKGAPGQRGPGGGRGGMRGGKTEIKLAKAAVKPMVLMREYVGEVSAAYSVDMRSTGSGWLKSLLVDVGTKVKKGQTLCIVDQDEMRAQKEQVEAQNRQADAQYQLAQAQNQQTEAGISVAESAVARADADLQQAISEDGRAEAMFKKGYISKSDYENQKTTVKKFQAALDAAKAQLSQAKAQYAQSKAQLAQARAQLAQSRAQLRTAQVKLDYLTVRAPFSGIVAEKYVDAGAYVSPSVSIVKLVDDSSVKVIVNATEEDLTRVSAGADASITSDAWPGRVFSGKVVRVSPVLETGSRTGAVEIHIKNKSGALKAGMMARVNLVVDRIPGALTVPVDAVVLDQATGGKYVAVMKGGKPEKRDVRTGSQTPDDVEIISGLSEGDTVIIGGMPPETNGGGGSRRGRGPGQGRSGKGR